MDLLHEAQRGMEKQTTVAWDKWENWVRPPKQEIRNYTSAA